MTAYDSSREKMAFKDAIGHSPSVNQSVRSGDYDDSVSAGPAQKRPFNWDRIFRWLLIFVLVAAIIGVIVYFVAVRDSDENDTSIDVNQSKDSSPSSTPVPSYPPTTDFSPEDVQGFLISKAREVGGEPAFSDDASPQTDALLWVLGNQRLGSYSPDQIVQRFVLATVYFSAGGNNWKNVDGWLSDLSECDWYSSDSDSSICNSRDEITEIDLDSNNLAGILPWAELALLSSQLQTIDIFQNSLSGKISTQIGLLSSLITLDFYSNQISGTMIRFHSDSL